MYRADTHEEFDVIWRDGKYFVSTPKLDTIRVVPLLRYNAMKFERDLALSVVAPKVYPKQKADSPYA